jgi:hypothetical protein
MSGVALVPAGTRNQQIGRNKNCLGIVIGHGIGGKVIPAKMAQLAESQLLE